MKAPTQSTSLRLFYVLFSYVLLQFAWWSYLMLDMNVEIIRLKTEVVLLNSTSPEETVKVQKELHTVLNKKRVMVIGEGTIFLALLLLGFFSVRRSFKKGTQLAQQQSNFLLSVTHELKSPIASTRLQLETLLLREIDKSKQKEILQNAVADTDRLNALVENILLATQIDKANFVLHRQELNISEHISALLLRDSIIQYHSLVKSIQPNIFFAIDKTSFDSIILNLLDNACKYSPAESIISLELKETEKNIQLNIYDEGMGVNDEEKKQVFQKFYRIGDEKTRKTKGTGLGLYIVKYLVEEHGGIINIADNKPQGAVFKITFFK